MHSVTIFHVYALHINYSNCTGFAFSFTRAKPKTFFMLIHSCKRMFRLLPLLRAAYTKNSHNFIVARKFPFQRRVARTLAANEPRAIVAQVALKKDNEHARVSSDGGWRHIQQWPNSVRFVGNFPGTFLCSCVRRSLEAAHPQLQLTLAFGYAGTGSMHQTNRTFSMRGNFQAISTCWRLTSLSHWGNFRANHNNFLLFQRNFVQEI